jgi:hypothetical protein
MGYERLTDNQLLNSQLLHWVNSGGLVGLKEWLNQQPLLESLSHPPLPISPLRYPLILHRTPMIPLVYDMVDDAVDGRWTYHFDLRWMLAMYLSEGGIEDLQISTWWIEEKPLNRLNLYSQYPYTRHRRSGEIEKHIGDKALSRECGTRIHYKTAKYYGSSRLTPKSSFNVISLYWSLLKSMLILLAY